MAKVNEQSGGVLNLPEKSDVVCMNLEFFYPKRKRARPLFTCEGGKLFLERNQLLGADPLAGLVVGLASLRFDKFS